ncbi:MAG: hypothetical protein AAF194_06995, partial [Pseudomonadota bacterium]
MHRYCATSMTRGKRVDPVLLDSGGDVVEGTTALLALGASKRKKIGYSSGEPQAEQRVCGASSLPWRALLDGVEHTIHPTLLQK